MEFCNIICDAFCTPRVVIVAAVLCMTAVSAASELPESRAQMDYPHLGVRVETVARELDTPWSMDWLPDGTMIFTERDGRLSTLGYNDTDPVLVHVFSSGGGQEAGLLGVAVDPDFERNGFVYVYYTYQDLFSLYNKIERYQYAQDDTGAGRLHDGHVILDGIPASPWHDGGRIQFGPDGMLYAATGDAIRPELSQDSESLAGKILRMNPDGTIPKDNPSEGLVYSMGHRNPQGIDWTDDHTMIITEHGPSGRLGIGHDEINVITPGGNYGWPIIIGSSGDATGDNAGMPNAEYLDPVLHTGSVTWAPSGSEFYESDAIPEWQGNYFVATLRGQGLQMLDLDPDAGYLARDQAVLFEGEFGRLRDVQTGPDGYLYLLTSNRDGRGLAAPEDDRILRILPLYEPAIRPDGRDGGPDNAATQEQQLATLVYRGPETANTGPLYAALRHPGYEVSDILFSISQKSIEFDFERTSARLMTGPYASLSVYVERPLISAPFEVILYDQSGPVVHGADGTHTIRSAPDHYVITVNPGLLQEGRVAIVGTHVVPEFGHSLGAAIIVASAAAVILAGYAIQKRDAAAQSKASLLIIPQHE